MEKEWYKSKTVWGFGVFFLLKYLETQAIFSVDQITPLLETAAAIFGIYGARDAIGKK